jgi:nucleoside-diphosphate-sugar epimerase
MPAITSPLDSTILVTGANGFLATWTIGNLLQRGYAVRAAVRSKDKGEHLEKLYKSFGSRMSLIIVGSMDEVCLSKRNIERLPQCLTRDLCSPVFGMMQ